MIRFLLASGVNFALGRFMRVQPQNIKDTLFALQQGIRNGVHQRSIQRIIADQETFPWYKQLFYREGYAMGLACLHAIKFSPQNPDKLHSLPQFRIMHYTGYGFYNGVASELGFRKVSYDKNHWDGVGDYPEFYPFLIGGETFGQTITHKHWNANFVKSFDIDHQYFFYKEAAWHGCGRSLWFKFNQDIPALVEALEVYPPATKELLLGVGVAISFTQIAQPQKVISDIKRFPKKYHHALKEGAGISLATMTFEHQAVTKKLKEIYKDNELKMYFDNALHWGETLPYNENWYHETIYQIRKSNAEIEAKK